MTWDPTARFDRACRRHVPRSDDAQRCRLDANGGCAAGHRRRMAAPHPVRSVGHGRGRSRSRPRWTTSLRLRSCAVPSASWSVRRSLEDRSALLDGRAPGPSTTSGSSGSPTGLRHSRSTPTTADNSSTTCSGRWSNPSRSTWRDISTGVVEVTDPAGQLVGSTEAVAIEDTDTGYDTHMVEAYHGSGPFRCTAPAVPARSGSRSRSTCLRASIQTSEPASWMRPPPSLPSETGRPSPIRPRGPPSASTRPPPIASESWTASLPPRRSALPASISVGRYHGRRTARHPTRGPVHR